MDKQIELGLENNFRPQTQWARQDIKEIIIIIILHNKDNHHHHLKVWESIDRITGWEIQYHSLQRELASRAGKKLFIFLHF